MGPQYTNLHALPIIGKDSNGDYIVQDEYFAFGDNYQTLQETFLTILGPTRSADHIAIVSLTYYKGKS